MLADIFIIALISAFTILLITKIGLRDFVIEHGPKLISRMFDCDFCLSFWTSVLVTAGMVLVTKDLSLALVPMLSTPITRILI